MSTIINIILAIIVFGAIIFFHELGHFIFAKSNGIYVNEFAVGMGPTIFSFRKKETKYCLKAIPMGGYCMMMGEDEDVADEHSFSQKPVWGRISVVIAGPVFNFILAFLLSIILVGFCGYDLPIITDFTKDSPAQEAGLEVGDIITEYNGHTIYNFREVMVYNQFNQSSDPVKLKIERDGKEKEVTVTPLLTDNGYIMGIYSSGRTKGNVFSVIKYSAFEVRYYIKTTFLSLKYLIEGKVGIKNLSGPVGIVSMMSDTIDEAKESAAGNNMEAARNVFLNLVNFCIMLSANLGVMNLLPLPALDGGRTLVLLVEAFFKKKMSAGKEAFINAMGFAFLILLMVVVMIQDIMNLVR